MDFLDKPKSDLLDLAVPIIKNNPTWQDMLCAFSNVMDINVENPIEQLERIRFVVDTADDNMLKNTARLLGFDLDQDVLNLNSNNLTKLVTQLSMYPDQNGTELFTKFIDLVLNSLTKVDNLYTKDYVNFYTKIPSNAKDIVDGGQWFKTTHIDLDIALFSFETLELHDGQTLQSRTKELFYSFAPAPLVIERLNFVVMFEDKDWLGGSALAIGTSMPQMEAIIIVD